MSVSKLPLIYKDFSLLELTEDTLKIVDKFYSGIFIADDLKQRGGEIRTLYENLMVIKLKLIQLDENIGKSIC